MTVPSQSGNHFQKCKKLFLKNKMAQYEDVFQTDQEVFNTAFRGLRVYTSQPKKISENTVHDYLVNGRWVLFQLEYDKDVEVGYTAPQWFCDKYTASLSKRKSFLNTQYFPVNLVLLVYESERKSFSILYVDDILNTDVPMMYCVLQFEGSISYRFSILYNPEKCLPPFTDPETLITYHYLWEIFGLDVPDTISATRRLQNSFIDSILSKKTKAAQSKKISFALPHTGGDHRSLRWDEPVLQGGRSVVQQNIKKTNLKPSKSVYILQQFQDAVYPRRKKTLQFFINKYFQQTSQSQRSLQHLNRYLEKNGVSSIEAYGVYYKTLMDYFNKQKEIREDALKKKQQQKRKKEQAAKRRHEDEINRKKKQYLKNNPQQQSNVRPDYKNIPQQQDPISQHDYSLKVQSFVEWGRSLPSHILTTNSKNIYRYICRILRLEDLSEWTVNTPPQNMFSVWNCVLSKKGQSLKELNDGSCEEFRREVAEAIGSYIEDHKSFKTTVVCFHKNMTEEDVYTLLERCLRNGSSISFTFKGHVNSINSRKMSQSNCKTFYTYIRSRKNPYSMNVELSLRDWEDIQLYTRTQIIRDMDAHDLLKLLPYEPFSIEYVCFDLEKCTRDLRSSCVSFSRHNERNNETIVLFKIKNNYSYLWGPDNLTDKIGIHFIDPSFFQ